VPGLGPTSHARRDASGRHDDHLVRDVGDHAHVVGEQTCGALPVLPEASQQSPLTDLNVRSILFASELDANMLVLTPTPAPVTLVSKRPHLHPILRQSGWT
jgi:hypothetical protein